MNPKVPARQHILLADGAWTPLTACPETFTLVSFEDGLFKPYPARKTRCVAQSSHRYRTGSLKYIHASPDMGLLTESGWRPLNDFYFGSKLSTHHVLKNNSITVPGRVSVFGAVAKPPAWQDALALTVATSDVLYVPDYLMYLDERSLRKTLGKLLMAHYPHLADPYKGYEGGWLPSTPPMKLLNIDQGSRILLVQLLARFGIRTRRWERSALIIKDAPNKNRMADLLGIYKSKTTDTDITTTDWIWSHTPIGDCDHFIIETDAPNICDGLFIWRQLK